LVIEDCAQAYVGNRYHGHPGADVSMFSFGPIKTNTALGGGVMVVRDDGLRRRMHEAHRRWPINGRWSFAKRVFKYASVRFISSRWVAGAIATVARWLGTDHDVLATKMARGFPGPRFFEKIRQQPSSPLIRLLASKLQSFDPAFIERRARRGMAITEQLASRVDVVGSQMLEPTYWVYPILVEQRDALVRKLWQLGFDATTRSSLVPVNRVRDDSGAFSPETPESAAELPVSHFVLKNLVFVPFEVSIPARAMSQIVHAILESNPTRPARPSFDSRAREPAIAGANDST
jgi:dTDP-4-amino-4,6-dideoxygalactose transaminase